MKKKILFALLCTTLCAGSHIKAQEAMTPKSTLVMLSEDGGAMVALPLNGTVIKFRGDSIDISHKDHQSSYGRNEIGSFSHQVEHRSELKVRLLTDNDFQYPVEGLYVTMMGEKIKDIYGIVQVSDEDGVASFPYLATGIYDILVEDKLNNFEAKETCEILHAHNDEVVISLEERVRSPYLLYYNISTEDPGWFDIWLTWEMEEQDEGDENFNPYTYEVYLNGELHGQTTETSYVISKLEAGEYEISVLPVSSYGNYAKEGRHINVKLDTTLIVEVITDKESPDIYYDLQGRRLCNIGNLAPGIYIKNGKKVMVNPK